MAEEPTPYGEATLGERLIRRLHAADDGELEELNQTGHPIADDSVANATVEASE